MPVTVANITNIFIKKKRMLRNVINKLFGWLLVSNRPAHILCVCLMSIVLGWQGGVGAIIALEYKDVQHGGWKCWDWLDVVAGLIGCAVGGWLNWVIIG